MGVKTWVGGDRIQRKIIFSLSLMFTLTIFLIIATSSAATVNQSITNVKTISTTNSGVQTSITTNIKKTTTSTQPTSVLTLAQMQDGL